MAYSDYLVTTRALHDHLEDPQWRVVDCRFYLDQPEKGFSEYLAGHIPGAVYAHLDRDLAGPVSPVSGRHPLPRPESFARTLGRLGISPKTQVVAYDQGGGAIAARLWWMLRWAGHPSVRLLDGGFGAWQRNGLPLDTAIPAVEAVNYPVQTNESMTVTTREVVESVAADAPLQLIDARDAARYEGRSEPIDPVAGHIPGARNLPFSVSLAPDGVWRRPEELREAWAQILQEGPEGAATRPLAAMCGSGVTACHLVLSAALAGLPLPRLYVGSWSEWIRDAARPVAIGPAPGGPSATDGP